jgi:hypothetical protein
MAAAGPSSGHLLIVNRSSNSSRPWRGQFVYLEEAAPDHFRGYFVKYLKRAGKVALSSGQLFFI